MTDKPLILADALAKALEQCRDNDKTPAYEYSGKHAVNRNGVKPGSGTRWATPREIATEALSAYHLAKSAGEVCPECEGSGYQPKYLPDGPNPCPKCEGSGKPTGAGVIEIVERNKETQYHEPTGAVCGEEAKNAGM